MMSSLIRKKLSRGETVFCAKTSYQNSEIVELMGTFGFDGVWICLEHRRMDPSTVYSLIRACRLAKLDAIIRIKPANYADLLWLLEAGAHGIMLPRVSHADEVRQVVAAMKFPPLGQRGLDGVQADANFGHLPTLDYLARANQENFLVVQIEDAEVIPHIDAIAALPGVDVLFVGPGDLSLSLGKVGKKDDSEIQAILSQVAEACRRHGKTAGIPCAPEDVKKYYALGYRFFNVISDYRLLFDGLMNVQAKLEAAGVALGSADAASNPIPVPTGPISECSL